MADQPKAGQDSPPPARQPYGPGPLLLFGLVLVGVAAFCFKDVVYPATAAAQWKTEGKDWYIPMNWAVMFVATAVAVYAFIMAAVRSKKNAGAADADQASEPPKSGT